ncbi:hypothetical protein B296_00037894 [Ensete ventricosum]|uniref:Uncharacterized protein n=1 Tax=Ensete ventricosum TaxID=4639 RepID=A0A426ZJJ1_ENSVE|nr:hypothetical protein B296_00037894 [Ensete ventricosum]
MSTLLFSLGMWNNSTSSPLSLLSCSLLGTVSSDYHGAAAGRGGFLRHHLGAAREETVDGLPRRDFGCSLPRRLPCLLPSGGRNLVKALSHFRLRVQPCFLFLSSLALCRTLMKTHLMMVVEGGARR